MGVLPVKKLIISMSLPMMISMLVQALYNVVDSIFVAQVSKDALAAVTYAFPMQTMMIAVGSGTGVGINALLSKSLGEKNFKRANAAANNGLFLTILSALVFLGVGLLGAGPFIRSQVSNPQIVDYGTTYLGICCSFSFGIFFQMTLERLLQSTGLTIFSMISQGTGAVINIIFDPILIFGYFGFPKLGVAGAAYATVLGQCVAAVLGLILNLKFNKEKAWDGGEVGFGGLRTIGGSRAGDIVDGGGNIASSKPGWYLMIITAVVDGRNIVYDAEFENPDVYLMGPVTPNGDWKELEDGTKLDIPTTLDGQFVSPAFARSVPGGDGDGVRAYVKIEGFDWWKTEFMVFDGKIKYRGAGGDQDRVAGSAGQKLYLNFANDTGEIK